MVSSASAEVDAVALTIDDGGSAEVTGHVLDVLAARGVTATLFPTGWSLAGYPEVWARAVAEGHELGNHTFSHSGVGGMSPAEVQEEVVAWEEAVAEAVGAPYRARWFRPPYGDGFADGTGPRATREALAELGYSTALWDVETYFALSSPSGPQAGGAEPTADDVARHVLSTAGPGSVVLLHFGPLDVGALPTIIDGLRARGLEPVTMTGLIERQAALEDGA